MQHFASNEEYKHWIDSQDWYQTIELPSGLKTPGKFPTHKRTAIFDEIDFTGKTVLDVGCNSGQYCLMAKERGAKEVIGVDINTVRIEQGRTLAAHEGLDVTFYEQGIFDLGSFKRKFDIVLCIAVLTEVQNIFGAIEQLKGVIGGQALIELDIAKPLVYVSASKKWIKGYETLSRRTAVAEVRQYKNGEWMVSPSFDVLCAVFGTDFTLTQKEGGVRYDLVEVNRIQQ